MYSYLNCYFLRRNFFLQWILRRILFRIYFTLLKQPHVGLLVALLWIFQVYYRIQISLLQHPQVPYSGYSRYTVGYTSPYSSSHTSAYSSPYSGYSRYTVGYISSTPAPTRPLLQDTALPTPAPTRPLLWVLQVYCRMYSNSPYSSTNTSPTLGTPCILQDVTRPTPAPTRPLLWILQVYYRIKLSLFQHPQAPYSGYSRYTIGYNSPYSSTHKSPFLDTPGILQDTTLPTPAPTRPLLWVLQVYCRMQLALLQYPHVPYSGYSRYTVGCNSPYSSTQTSPTLDTPGILQDTALPTPAPTRRHKHRLTLDTSCILVDTYLPTPVPTL